MFRIAAQLVSWLAIAGVVLPPVAFLLEKVELEDMKLALLISTIVWFIATPLWMGANRADTESAD